MKKTISGILSLLLIAMCLFPSLTEADSWGSWSDWSTTAVTASDTVQVQTKTQYRKATRTASWTKSSSGNIDYASSWTSGFNKSSSLYTKYNKSPKTASTTSSQKVTVSTSTIGYIYYHWCRGAKLEQPYNRYINSNKTSTYNTFHAFYSTSNISLNTSANARKKSYYSLCQDTYWWLNERITIKRCAYVIYKKTYSSWSSWSSWQDSSIASGDTTKVDTRTVYRYRTLSDSSNGQSESNTQASESATKSTAASTSSGSATTFNKKGTLVSVKSPKKKTVTIKWKKVSGASGYQCYFSLKKDFKMYTVQRPYSKKKTKATVKNFPSKKTYYVKIRPFKKQNGKKVYGAWSKVKKVKIK